MVRSHNTVQLHTLKPEDVSPLIGGAQPTFQAALHAIVTWASSRTLREQVMADSGFPLPSDLGAFLVVNQLIYRGAARPTDLADAVDTSRSNMSRIVARLEDAGLVFRATDPKDDRGVVIGLTPLGRDAGARILHASKADTDGLPGFSREEFEALERLTLKFAATLDAMPDHPLATTAGIGFHEPATAQAN